MTQKFDMRHNRNPACGGFADTVALEEWERWVNCLGYEPIGIGYSADECKHMRAAYDGRECTRDDFPAMR